MLAKVANTYSLAALINIDLDIHIWKYIYISKYDGTPGNVMIQYSREVNGGHVPIFSDPIAVEKFLGAEENNDNIFLIRITSTLIEPGKEIEIILQNSRPVFFLTNYTQSQIWDIILPSSAGPLHPPPYVIKESYFDTILHQALMWDGLGWRSWW